MQGSEHRHPTEAPPVVLAQAVYKTGESAACAIVEAPRPQTTEATHADKKNAVPTSL
jgi:hypothetical protein